MLIVSNLTSRHFIFNKWCIINHHASMWGGLWNMMEHNWGMQFDNLGYWGHQDGDDDQDEESFDGKYHHIVLLLTLFVEE